MKWIDAIKKVMQEENRPMHYTEITEKIILNKYRNNNELGKTPQMSVSMFLTTKNEIFERINDGVYSLKSINIHNYWIISSNNNRFRLKDCINDIGYVDWEQGRFNFKVGDIIFIYCSAPDSSIRYMMEVIDNNIPTNKAFNDEEYWKNSNEFRGDQEESRYCRLKFVCESTSPNLHLSKLKNNWLKSAPQSPQKISQQLQNYIINIFENYSVDDDLIDEGNKTIYEGLRKQVFMT